MAVPCCYIADTVSGRSAVYVLVILLHAATHYIFLVPLGASHLLLLHNNQGVTQLP
jgi:hypothetical protein